MTETVTSIKIGGFILLEPNLLLTNLVVTAVSWYLYYKLYPLSFRQPVIQRWNQYLFFLGLSTLTGGIFGHALLYYLPFEFKSIGWVCSAVGAYFFELGIFEEAHHVLGWKKGWRWIPKIKLMVFLMALVIPGWFHFNLVVINTALGVIGIILPVCIALFMRTKNKAYSQMILAFLFAFTPGLVFLLKISPSPWFNHKDIGHLLMAIFVWILYRGIHERAVAKDLLHEQ